MGVIICLRQPAGVAGPAPALVTTQARSVCTQSGSVLEGPSSKLPAPGAGEDRAAAKDEPRGAVSTEQQSRATTEHAVLPDPDEGAVRAARDQVSVHETFVYNSKYAAWMPSDVDPHEWAKANLAAPPKSTSSALNDNVEDEWELVRVQA